MNHRPRPVANPPQGFVRLTTIALNHNVRIDNWVSSKPAQRAIAACAKSTGTEHPLVVCGGNGETAGTWAHWRLAISFVLWIDDTLVVEMLASGDPRSWVEGFARRRSVGRAWEGGAIMGQKMAARVRGVSIE